MLSPSVLNQDTVDWVENGTFFAVAGVWFLSFCIVAYCKPRRRSSWERVKVQDDKYDPSQPKEGLPSAFSHGDVIGRSVAA